MHMRVRMDCTAIRDGMLELYSDNKYSIHHQHPLAVEVIQIICLKGAQNLGKVKT